MLHFDEFRIITYSRLLLKYGLVFISDTRSTCKLGAIMLFSIQKKLVLAHWYCFTINLWIWEHISEHAPHLSATVMSKLFSTIKFVMKTPFLEVLKDRFVWIKVVAWQMCVFMCFSQYMSPYYFILTSPWWAQPPWWVQLNSREKNTQKSLVESSLDICYTIWNQILTYRQPLEFRPHSYFVDFTSHALFYIMTSFPAFVKVGGNPCYLGETSCKYVHFSVFMNCWLLSIVDFLWLKKWGFKNC
jgi:hypothetical protein